MPQPLSTSADASLESAAVARLGCISFLNVVPLIEGLAEEAAVALHFEVPSRLLGLLETGAVDMALCPVIDYQRSHEPLQVVPVGGIGSFGETLTVCLLSQTPFEKVREVYVDSDSHTSVALTRVLLAQRWGLRPALLPFDARAQQAAARGELPPTVLLIGDKVVHRSWHSGQYRYRLDLGQAWRELTGLPFVFAVWMARAQPRIDLRAAAAVLERQRQGNASQIDAIARRRAPEHGWDVELAQRYLGQMLRYEVGSTELEAMRTFWRMAHEQGAIEELRELRVMGE